MHFKKYIPISSRVDSLSNDMTYNIHINNSELKKVTHDTKFLGVIIDENLTWEQHIKALSKKLASCTGSLNRIIQFLLSYQKICIRNSTTHFLKVTLHME